MPFKIGDVIRFKPNAFNQFYKGKSAVGSDGKTYPDTRSLAGLCFILLKETYDDGTYGSGATIWHGKEIDPNAPLPSLPYPFTPDYGKGETSLVNSYTADKAEVIGHVDLCIMPSEMALLQHLV